MRRADGLEHGESWGVECENFCENFWVWVLRIERKWKQIIARLPGSDSNQTWKGKFGKLIFHLKTSQWANVQLSKISKSSITLTEYNSHVTPSDLGRSGDKWLNGCCNRLVGDMFCCVSHFRHSLDLRRVSSAFSWSRFCSLQELIDRSLTTSEAVPGDRKQRKQRTQLVETTNYHQLSNATDTKRHKKNQ